MITTDILKELGFVNPLDNMWIIGNIDTNKEKINNISYIIEEQICEYKSIERKCETPEEIIKFVESINFLFDLTIEIDEYNPYCELCGGCGEDGCCSHINCFRALIKNPKCKFGETYIQDSSYTKKITEMSEQLISEVESHEITEDQIVSEYNRRSNDIFNEIYY